jgi:hypothetical protein
MASSSRRATGMNSGIRSIGEANHANANHIHALLPLWTRGSPSSPRNRTTRFGMSVGEFTRLRTSTEHQEDSDGRQPQGESHGDGN